MMQGGGVDARLGETDYQVTNQDLTGEESESCSSTSNGILS